MWENIHKITNNANSVLDIDLVKSHVSEDSDDFDDLIQFQMDAAVSTIEGPRGIGVALLTNQYTLKFDY
jgi:hypothetical protein